MGDGGSLFAGFTLASLAIAAPIPNTRIFLSAILCPVLTFLYPLFDTVLVSFLRRAAGTPIYVGGRDHSSHRLASLGLGDQKTVWLLWALTAAGSVAGIFTYWMPLGVLAVGLLLVVAAIMFGIFLASLPGYEFPESAPVRSNGLRQWIPRLRTGLTLLIDVLLSGVALLTAFLVRWEDTFTGEPRSEFVVSLPVVMGCQLFACILFRTYRLGWRWSGADDIVTVAKAVIVSASSSIFIVWMGGLRGYSRGVIILFALLLFVFMSALRMFLRFLWRTLAVPKPQRRCAILAGNSSLEFLVLALQHDAIHNTAPVVVLGTDPAEENRRVHGVPVRYAWKDPVAILRQTSADFLIVASSHSLSPEQRDIVDACSGAGIPVDRFEIALRPYQKSAHT